MTEKMSYQLNSGFWFEAPAVDWRVCRFCEVKGQRATGTCDCEIKVD